MLPRALDVAADRIAVIAVVGDDRDADRRAFVDRLQHIGPRASGRLRSRLSLSTDLARRHADAVRAPAPAWSAPCRSRSTEVSSPLWVYVRPIRSIMPWTVPSSPGVPWSALNTTSGFSSASRRGDVAVHVELGDVGPAALAQARRRRPRRWSATLRARPTSRPSARRRGRSLFIRLPDPLDFPFEGDVGFGLHPAADFLAQRLDVGARRATEVEQEIAMLFRDLGVADA